MARGQKQGTGSTTIWLIVFAVLWGVSTVMAIMMYTGQEELKQRYTQKENETQNLRQSLSRAESARNEIAALATGEPQDDAAAVEAKLDGLVSTIESANLFQGANRLADLSYHQLLDRVYKALAEANTRETDLAARLAGVEGQLNQFAAASATQEQEFTSATEKIREQFTESESSREKYREERDQEVQQIVANADLRRKQADADLTAERERNTELKESVSLLRDRNEAFQDKLFEVLAGPEPNSTARIRDGQILLAEPGQQQVFIDLGRGDKMVLGLKFAVYSRDAGIPADGRAKAQIEVVSIFERSSECEILYLEPGQFLMEGDIIANPVYDRSRPVRFVVAGVFDLDHDGMADKNGAGIIASLISDWGGTVNDELGAESDFLVLGAAPRRPRAGSDPTGQNAGRVAAIQRTYDAYVAAIEAAKLLHVPVLPQEVFLNYLGYTSRYAGR